MSLQEVLTDIQALEQELSTFERKFGIRSETFYAAYVSGEEPEDENWVLDFGEWASVYRTWLSRQVELEKLKEQEKVFAITDKVRAAYEAKGISEEETLADFEKFRERLYRERIIRKALNFLKPIQQRKEYKTITMPLLRSLLNRGVVISINISHLRC